MRGRSRFELCDRPNKGLTPVLLISAWMCLALCTLVYFGSLLAVIYISSFGLAVKWNYVAFCVTTGVLYLLNIISNALLISSGPSVSNEDGAQTQSSALRNRGIDSFGTRLPGISGSQSLCHQEVQTNERRITPPPPYDYPPVRTSGEVQRSTNVRPQVATFADIVEMLNKIFLAVNNNRTLISEQPPQREQDVPEPQASGDSQLASSGSDIYPQFPTEVMEQLSDPNALVRALARHKSKNGIKQCLGNGKNIREENQQCRPKHEAINRLNAQRLQGESLENSDSDINSSTSSVSSHIETLHAALRRLKKPSITVHQKAIARNRQLSRQGNCDLPAVPSQNLSLPKPKRNFSSTDNLTCNDEPKVPLLAQSSVSLPVQESITLPRRKEVSQPYSSCPIVPLHGATSNQMGDSMRNLGSTSSRASQQSSTSQRVSKQDLNLTSTMDSHSNLTLQCQGNSEDLGLTCSSDSQQNLTSLYQKNSKDLGSTSLRDSQPNLTSNYQRTSKQDLSSSLKDSQPNLTSQYQKISKQDLGSSSRDSQQNLTSKYEIISQQDLSSTSSRDSPQNLTSQYRRISKKDLGSTNSKDSQLYLCSTSPATLQDIGSANSIGIPLIDNPSSRPDNSSYSAKSEEYISFDKLEHEQARSDPNEPLTKTRSIHALHPHQYIPIKRGQEIATDSTSDLNLPEVKDVHKFSTEPDVRDHMKPAEWFAAWNRGINRTSLKHDSVLIGARL